MNVVKGNTLGQDPRGRRGGGTFVHLPTGRLSLGAGSAGVYNCAGLRFYYSILRNRREFSKFPP
jgi:hypothetical protein